jgi:hypothetical protein
MRLLPALSTLLFIGCAAKTIHQTPTEPTSRDYAPLKVGASWTYDVQYPGQKGQMTVKIVGEKEGYFLQQADKGDPVGVRHTEEGFRDAQRFMIHNPLKAGSTWKSVVSASAVEHYSIVSIGEKCDCPAGQFDDCLVIESKIRRDPKVSLIARFTWAKDVGLVRIDTDAEIEGKGRIPQVHQTLVKYALAPSAASPSVSTTTETKKQQDDAEAPAWEH